MVHRGFTAGTFVANGGMDDRGVRFIGRYSFGEQCSVDAFASTGAVSTGAAFATLSRRVLQGPNGWAFLGFGATTLPSQSQQSMTPTSATLAGSAAAPVAIPGVHFGLPVIGAMFHNYTNSGVASSYGGVIPHKYTRNIQ